MKFNVVCKFDMQENAFFSLFLILLMHIYLQISPFHRRSPDASCDIFVVRWIPGNQEVLFNVTIYIYGLKMKTNIWGVPTIPFGHIISSDTADKQSGTDRHLSHLCVHFFRTFWRFLPQNIVIWQHVLNFWWYKETSFSGKMKLAWYWILVIDNFCLMSESTHKI